MTSWSCRQVQFLASSQNEPDSRGRGPAIHDFIERAKVVDGRHTGGHDEIRQPCEPKDVQIIAGSAASAEGTPNHRA
jgi:hypothetical protein